MKHSRGLFSFLVLTVSLAAQPSTLALLDPATRAREEREQARQRAAYLEDQNNRILDAQAEILRRLDEALPKERTSLEKQFDEIKERAEREAAVTSNAIARFEAEQAAEARRLKAVRAAEVAAMAPAPAPTPAFTDPRDTWRAAEAVSILWTHNKYPFLADSAHPKRKQFDDYVAKMRQDPKNAYLFGMACWPELMAIDCARLYRW